ncbi:class I SAM-dependent methyltransferase [Parasphingopyxis algicola]|uniref:SAM-dependent methyltransferase n=1 Tax=Parasphingopyxis algicola TaxID=2026624 RepID=UPI0015A30079|nr:cyclopropane-fatty-acyl-phospholipid synthase family protein [Parasphingopyxis algicola]QLC24036.1 class I SAM-dependent methyltransferase [Parasphingopyxis algicola]
MASSPSPRGEHLLKADRGFSTGSSRLSRLFAPGFHKLLDRIDAGLATGQLDARLPDGETRILGGRAPGVAAEIELTSWRPLIRLMTSGSVGWYRGWAEGEWASPAPEKLFELFVVNQETLGNTGRAKGLARWVNRQAHRMRANNRENARRNIAAHYDLGNDFYASWLDPSMTYSSAVFAEPIGGEEDLEAAQHRKLKLLLDRLDLKPGDRLLEIGCGWGGLMEVAARDYGAEVTGITLSTEQKAHAEQRLADAGLAGQCRVELTDYRDVAGSFDAVASVEMVEAVGQEYWPAYLGAIAARLKPGGRAAIQLISMDAGMFEGYAANTDFIQTYVFPGGMLIEEGRFAHIAREQGLSWRDRTGYHTHYAETLRRWRANFDRAIAEQRLPDGFDARFHDLWRYYLMYCEGGFQAGGIDVAQVTLVKED